MEGVDRPILVYVDDGARDVNRDKAQPLQVNSEEIDELNEELNEVFNPGQADVAGQADVPS